uniref:BAR domain-containing protein n=1 Tax=Anopheles maculatus TaxID=74869 RepID=A0A182SE31_9DIPT
MAFAGLKKQINKANQVTCFGSRYVTEKMGGAEGTKLDLDFMEMERKTDVTVELVEELQAKTKEYLQPNPTARAKMAAVKGISKLSGQAKSNTYPQPEGILADCMLTYGKKLGEDSIFGKCNAYGVFTLFIYAHF